MIPDTSEILISADEIKDMVERVADEINRDYGDKPVLVIPVLTGAFIFAADLVRLLKMPVEIDFMKVSSYVGQSSTGELKISKDLSVDVKGKDVLLVEDVIDTGFTLSLLRQMIVDRGAKSVKICTAFNKPSGRTVDIDADYSGIEVGNYFIVGYGLDLDGMYRDYGDIRVVKDKEQQ
ncbi:MAG: hypoxanthine phosphoribosyltransferase [Clostridiales bacterium]|nr:hypoxanthine phosphoribosyltransferase [Clostridiales bacterium]MBO4578732.1 hypoxanthine phosphoribosyltransferase [Clostridiales bacterium]